jgi:four helix bundle protein
MDADRIGRILVSQVLRSETSIGASMHEAQGGQSKKDFIAKMIIARKEAVETSYWLCLIGDSGLQPEERTAEIIGECDQIARIISAIILSAKRNPLFCIHHSPFCIHPAPCCASAGLPSARSSPCGIAPC